MGKSLYVQRLAENTGGSHVVHVPVHGPVVTADSIIDLLEHNEDTACSIFHFDVAPTVRTYCIIITISLYVYCHSIHACLVAAQGKCHPILTSGIERLDRHSWQHVEV